MSFEINNLLNNGEVCAVAQKGPFTVIEYMRDLSVSPSSAPAAWFCEQMNVRKRQVLVELSKSGVITQAGAMQIMCGNVKCTTGVKGVGDFLGKAFKGAVSNTSVVKPEYTGDGLLLLEPDFKHNILLDVAEWNNALVVDDGLFLACESKLKLDVVARSNISSAIAGGEGLFNLGLKGAGIVCLKSRVPREELVEVTLTNDVLKIDQSCNAVAWSGSLEFTTERAGTTLIGSAASGEGLVNCFRGSGKVLLALTERLGSYTRSPATT